MSIPVSSWNFSAAADLHLTTKSMEDLGAFYTSVSRNYTL